MKKTLFLVVTLICCVIVSCKKDKTQPAQPVPAPASSTPNLIIKLKFDSTQVRLDNFGNPSAVPAGNAAQSPVFFGLSSHFIELSQNDSVLPGAGVMLYKGTQTTAGGATAADFDHAIVKGNNETFITIPLSSIAPGTYEYLRASITYQNYDIKYRYGSTALVGRLSSFVGWNTYLTNYTIKTQSVTVNANKLQGYFGFESPIGVIQGQTPAGATTVPNPIAATSPIPAGSCLVTGQFASPFTITGHETNDITIVLSVSTNKSFEWKDNNANGTFEPLGGDTVVNMGLRGLIPIVQ